MNKEDLNPESPPPLDNVQERRLTTLIAEVYKITRSVHFLTFPGLGCVWFVIGSIALSAYFPEGYDSWAWNIIGGSALCLAFVPGLIRRIQLDRRMQELLTFHDKRMIEVLIETVPYTTHRWSNRAKTELIEQLLNKEPTDRGFNDDQRIQLHKILKGEDAPLIVAALHALKQVGTLVSLRHVNILVAGGGVASQNESVRAAAIACQTELRKQMFDRKNLGLLLEFMQARREYPDFWLEVRESLLQMLPQATVQDIWMSAKVRMDNRNMLYAYLLEGDAPLILAILQMCEQLGLVEALPYVEQLLSDNNRSKLLSQKVIETATGCQKALQQLLDKRNNPQILLRAANAPETSNQELMRPAIGEYAGKQEELLRATITTKES